VRTAILLVAVAFGLLFRHYTCRALLAPLRGTSY
jgi:hypothetical protein